MAISRYKNFATIKDYKTGKHRLETFPAIHGELLYSSSDIIITLSDAERIDKLASEHLGSGEYWWIICLLNNLVFPFGQKVAAGSTIRLPANVDNFISLIQSKVGE